MQNEVKELKNVLMPNSLSSESLLMSSTNTNLSVGNFTLKDFTNNFSDNFNTYFSYNSATGEITCKADGWYNIYESVDIQCYSGTTWKNTSVKCKYSNFTN